MRVKGWNALVGIDSDERIVRFAAMAIALAANVFFALYMFHAHRLAQEPRVCRILCKRGFGLQLREPPLELDRKAVQCGLPVADRHRPLLADVA